MNLDNAIRLRISELTGRPVTALTDDLPIGDLLRESFQRIEITVDLQETFKAILRQEDLVEISTVGDLIAVVARRARHPRTGERVT